MNYHFSEILFQEFPGIIKQRSEFYKNKIHSTIFTSHCENFDNDLLTGWPGNGNRNFYTSFISEYPVPVIAISEGADSSAFI